MENFRAMIADRRDGKRHSRTELTSLAKGAADGSIPDYQLSAWLMAAYLKPLDLEETTDLTVAMANTGARLDLSALPRPHIDKHSTGGVGDKTTLVLLPLLAACGLHIVKMSGGGLGLTGGTVDKLHSIPGFKTELTPEEMVSQAKAIGVSLSGQTKDLAPADKRLYELRDTTATTDSTPLIVSSILCKKIAGGAERILIDVKCGSGGFMKTLPEATHLANMLEEVGKRCGLKVSTEITDMNQPLGSAVGNSLEVEEAIQVLCGGPLTPASERFKEFCIEMAAEALVFCDLEPSLDLATKRIEVALSGGSACTKAMEWIKAQGGSETIAALLKSLPRAKHRREVVASRPGWVRSIDALKVAEAVLDLGGGRRTKTDDLDLSVGLTFDVFVGSRVKAGDRMFTVHANDEQQAEMAEDLVFRFVEVGTKVAPAGLFL